MKNTEIYGLLQQTKAYKAVESILNEQLSETYTSQWSVPTKTTHKKKILKETTDERGILLRERR